VSWALSDGSNTPLSTSPAVALANASGGDHSTVLTFRMQLALGTDEPGTYLLALTITLTAP
jgi:hypothetical protein